jgi:iron(III) transport system substrate-binding protein
MKKVSPRLILPAVLVSLCLGGGSAMSADMKALQAAARKEGEVTWYVASIDARDAAAAGRAFTAKYGPKVNVVQAPPQVTFQRLTQDLSQNAHNADVFSSVDVANFVTLKGQGLLMTYRPENAVGLLPAFQGLDKDATFHATIASVIVIAFNSDKVKANEAPQRWTDLTDAKWTNKIALGDPAFSGFGGTWATEMNKLYGASYFLRLKETKPQISRSVLDAVNLVALGERAVTVAPIAPILTSADQGKPIAIRYPIDGSILVATPSAVLKSAPHPNAAKLFMEFLLGPEFGTILVHARYESMRPDVKPLPGAKSVTDIKVIRPTVAETTKGAPQVTKVWHQVFGH